MERYFSENFLWQSRQPFRSNFLCAHETSDARKKAPDRRRTIRPENHTARLKVTFLIIRAPDQPSGIYRNRRSTIFRKVSSVAKILTLYAAFNFTIQEFRVSLLFSRRIFSAMPPLVSSNESVREGSTSSTRSTQKGPSGLA